MFDIYITQLAIWIMLPVVLFLLDLFYIRYENSYFDITWMYTLFNPLEYYKTLDRSFKDIWLIMWTVIISLIAIPYRTWMWINLQPLNLIFMVISSEVTDKIFSTIFMRKTI